MGTPKVLRWMAGGGFAAVFSAVGYTAANICLRASTDVPPSWVSAMKAVWTVIIFLPWVSWLVYHRTRMLPSRNQLLRLIAVAIFAQLAGNWCFQWSLGIIGLATVVPLTIGAMLIGGAILGRLFLNEGVTPATAAAIIVMLMAIGTLWWGVVHERRVASGSALPNISADGGAPIVDADAPMALSLGTRDANKDWFWAVLATAGACMTGAVYALLGITIRQTMREGVPLATPMIVVGLSGTIVLGSIAWREVGWEKMWSVPPTDLLFMCLAGIANAVAFLALTRSLKLIPVVYVNAINASQVAMAAVAGILIFQEKLTHSIALGVVLTILGFAILYVSGLLRRRARRTVLQTAASHPHPITSDLPTLAGEATRTRTVETEEPCGSGRLDS